MVRLSKIVHAFLRLDYSNPKHRKIMDLQRAKGYLLATKDDFAGIESAAIAAGLLKKGGSL